MLNKIKTYYCFFGGMTNICFWCFLIFNNDDIYYTEPPFLIDSLLFVDILGSCILISAGVAFVLNSALSEMLFFAGGGMYIYSICLSIGYYLQLEKTGIIVIFFILFAFMIGLMGLSLINMYRKAKIEKLTSSSYNHSDFSRNQ